MTRSTSPRFDRKLGAPCLSVASGRAGVGHRRFQPRVQFGVEIAHALGVAAEIVSPVARERAHIDARLASVGLDPDNDIVDEPEDERAVFRFDVPGCATALGRLLSDDPPM